VADLHSMMRQVRSQPPIPASAFKRVKSANASSSSSSPVVSRPSSRSSTPSGTPGSLTPSQSPLHSTRFMSDTPPTPYSPWSDLSTPPSSPYTRVDDVSREIFEFDPQIRFSNSILSPPQSPPFATAEQMQDLERFLNFILDERKPRP
jgi:hypothetical protein